MSETKMKCKYCGTKTPFEQTRLCPLCYELRNALTHQNLPLLAKIARDVGLTISRTKSGNLPDNIELGIFDENELVIENKEGRQHIRPKLVVAMVNLPVSERQEWGVYQLPFLYPDEFGSGISTNVNNINDIVRKALSVSGSGFKVNSKVAEGLFPEYKGKNRYRH